MNLIKGITYLALIIFVFSCKKTPVDSPYVFERDDDTTQGPVLFHTPTLTAQPQSVPPLGDSISGAFVCFKTRTYGNPSLTSGCRFYASSKPMALHALIETYSLSSANYDVQYLPTDSGDMTFAFTIGGQSYLIHSTRGYPNCILDYFPNWCGPYFPNYPVVKYKIRFNNSDYNTDRIFSSGNGDLDINEMDAYLKPYSCTANKYCYFSISFENYSYFKTKGKWFACINKTCDYREASVH
jgi:hypothetical protein